MGWVYLTDNLMIVRLSLFLFCCTQSHLWRLVTIKTGCSCREKETEKEKNSTLITHILFHGLVFLPSYSQRAMVALALHSRTPISLSFRSTSYAPFCMYCVPG